MGHYLTVMKWMPRFRLKNTKMSKTLVLFRFPGIYHEMLEEEVIAALGDIVGRTINVDAMSLVDTRDRFARCCVEVDLSAPLLPSIIVFDEEQKVEYEGLHLICFECGRYDHRAEACTGSVDINADGIGGVKTQAQATEIVGNKPASPYGPWMLPSYQRRKPQRKPERDRWRTADTSLVTHEVDNLVGQV